jgi:trehalose/maltose hydrolase-like predicted phosphorylase
MAGTLDLIQRGYLGTEIRGDVLSFSPRLIDRLDGLSFRMEFRGTPIRVSLVGRQLSVTSEGLGGRIEVAVGGEARDLPPGGRCTFTLDTTSTAGREQQESGHAVRF